MNTFLCCWFCLGIFDLVWFGLVLVTIVSFRILIHSFLWLMLNYKLRTIQFKPALCIHHASYRGVTFLLCPALHQPKGRVGNWRTRCPVAWVVSAQENKPFGCLCILVPSTYWGVHLFSVDFLKCCMWSSSVRDFHNP